MRHAKELMKKAKTHKVKPLDALGNDWEVTSGNSGKTYRVHLLRETVNGAIRHLGATCTCNWGQYKHSDDEFRSACSHTIAVWQEVFAGEEDRVISAWDEMEAAWRQKRQVRPMGDGIVLTTRKASKPQIKKAQRKRHKMASILWGDPLDEGF